MDQPLPQHSAATAVTPLCRLAVTGLNCAVVVPARVFKIFNTITDGGVISVCVHPSRRGENYLVASFKTAEAAQMVYDFCDGSAIEDTGESFNLSFIPADAPLLEPTESYTADQPFRMERERERKSVRGTQEDASRADMAVVDDADGACDDTAMHAVAQALLADVPAHLRSQPESAAENAGQPGKASAKPTDSVPATHDAPQKGPLEMAVTAAKPPNELEGFVFNINDPRLSRLFTEQDYMLDASNKLFAEQRESAIILAEWERRQDGLE